MANPDVRVKLSAEGVAEVVAALRNIQNEAAKTGRGGARDFLQLNNTLGSLERLAGAAAAAVATIGLAQLGRNAIAAAEDMQNLSARFGSSVRDLSAIDVALRRMGSSLKDQSRNLTTFFEKTQDAAQLGGQAADVFARLHMDPKQIEALAGKDLPGRLEAVAKAFKKMPEGPERTAAAIGALGTRGASLIPLLEEIGTKGLGGLATQADRLSSLLNGETVAAVGALNDAFDDMRIQSQGLATEFMAGFAGPMVAAIHGITGELKTSQQFWRDFGAFVGEVIGRIALEAALMADAVKTRFQTLASNLISLLRAAAAAGTGHFEEAQLHLEAIGLRRAKEEEDLMNRAALARRRFRERDHAEGRQKIREEEGEETNSFDRIAKARSEVRKAQADADIRVAREVAKAREDAESRSFAAGFVSVQTYYQRRRTVAVAAINDEIAALQKQALEAKRSNDPKDLAAAVKINGEISRLRVERAATVMRLNDEEADANRKLAGELLASEQQIAEAQGRRHTAALLAIDQEVARRAEALKGLPEGDRDSALQRLRATLELQERFNVAQDDATRAMADFGRERDAITRRVQAGLLSEVEGDAQIAQLEEERIGRLRELGAALLAVAQESGDPERVAKAQEFLGAVAEIEVSVEHARNTLLRLRAAFGDALQAGFEQFFASGVRDSKNLGDAFRQMASTILDSLNQIIARLIATQLAMAVLRLIPGGGQLASSLSPAAPVSAAAGGVDTVLRRSSLPFSEGGVVPGAGAGDSVPAMLTPGEYVVRAARVASPGVYEALEQLNRGMVSLAPLRALRGPQRFSEGGLVDAAGSGGGGTTSIELGLAEGLVVKAMDSPAGHRVIVRANARNRKAVGRFLGGRG